MNKKIKCPFCLEEINVGSKKCRYCGEWLVGHKKQSKHFLIALILASSIFFILGLTLIFAFNKNNILNTNVGTVTKQEEIISSENILNKENNERTKDSKKPFSLNEKLENSAKKQADDMCDRQYWSATNPDGKETWKWIKDEMYEYQNTGTNLARDYIKLSDLINSWMNSDTNKSNILSDLYTETGIAVLKCNFSGTDTLLVVQHLASPIDKTVIQSDKTPTRSSPKVKSTLIPTQNVQPINTVQPERKKVSFTTTEHIVDGTFYCYEDKINELTRKESEIKILTETANSCSFFKQLEVDNCTSTKCSVNDPNWTPDFAKSCIDECYKIKDECMPKHEAVGNKRKEYVSLIGQYCP